MFYPKWLPLCDDNPENLFSTFSQSVNFNYFRLNSSLHSLIYISMWMKIWVNNSWNENFLETDVDNFFSSIIFLVVKYVLCGGVVLKLIIYERKSVTSMFFFFLIEFVVLLWKYKNTNLFSVLLHHNVYWVNY